MRVIENRYMNINFPISYLTLEFYGSSYIDTYKSLNYFFNYNFKKALINKVRFSYPLSIVISRRRGKANVVL